MYAKLAEDFSNSAYRSFETWFMKFEKLDSKLCKINLRNNKSPNTAALAVFFSKLLILKDQIEINLELWELNKLLRAFKNILSIYLEIALIFPVEPFLKKLYFNKSFIRVFKSFFALGQIQKIEHCYHFFFIT
jgi:hypothetical protein